jgi:hypothetical protein
MKKKVICRSRVTWRIHWSSNYRCRIKGRIESSNWSYRQPTHINFCWQSLCRIIVDNISAATACIFSVNKRLVCSSHTQISKPTTTTWYQISRDNSWKRTELKNCWSGSPPPQEAPSWIAITVQKHKGAHGSNQTNPLADNRLAPWRGQWPLSRSAPLPTPSCSTGMRRLAETSSWKRTGCRCLGRR